MKMCYFIFFLFVSFVQPVLQITQRSGSIESSDTSCANRPDVYNCCKEQSSATQNIFQQNSEFQDCLSKATEANISKSVSLLGFLQSEQLLNNLEQAVNSTYGMISKYCPLGTTSGSVNKPWVSDSEKENYYKNLYSSVQNSSDGEYYDYCSLGTIFSDFKNNYFNDPFFYMCPNMFLYLINEMLKDGTCNSMQDNPCRDMYTAISNTYKTMLTGEFNYSWYNFKDAFWTDTCEKFKEEKTGIYHLELTDYTSDPSKPMYNAYKLFSEKYPKAFFNYVMLPMILVAKNGNKIIKDNWAIFAAAASGAEITPFAQLFTPINSNSGALWNNLNYDLQDKIKNDYFTTDLSEKLQNQNKMSQDNVNNKNQDCGFQLCNIFMGQVCSLNQPSTVTGNSCIQWQVPDGSSLIAKPIMYTGPSPQTWSWHGTTGCLYQNGSVSCPSGDYEKNWATTSTAGSCSGGSDFYMPINSISNIVMGQKMTSYLSLGWGLSTAANVSHEEWLSDQEKKTQPSSDNRAEDITSNQGSLGSFHENYKHGLYPRLFTCCPCNKVSSSGSTSASQSDQSCSQDDMHPYICGLGKTLYRLYYALWNNMKSSQELNAANIEQNVQNLCGNEVINKFKTCISTFQENALSSCKDSYSCKDKDDTSSSCTTCLSNQFSSHCGDVKAESKDCVNKMLASDKFKNIFKNMAQSLNNVTDAKIGFAKFVYENSYDKSQLVPFSGECPSNDYKGRDKLCYVTKKFGPSDLNLTYKDLLNWKNVSENYQNQSQLISHFTNVFYSNCPQPLKVDLVMSIISYIMMPLGLVLTFGDPIGILMMVGMQAASEVMSGVMGQMSAMQQSIVYETMLESWEDQG